jgi:hypothetical protein
MSKPSHIFFHVPCFDGIASAVLAMDYLGGRGGGAPATLRPQDHAARRRWLETPLPGDAAVVDFPYHPDARFWADHHETAFLSAAAEASFRRRSSADVAYDPEADSCAGLLWRHLRDAFGHRNPAYEELVRWADKIDAARYEFVDEALDAPSPALAIAATLEDSAAEQYSVDLVRALRRGSLEEVARSPEVSRRLAQAKRLQAAGFERMKESVRLRDGIVVFDLETSGVIVNRYSPYRIFPDADYSIGILRRPDGAKITAMRNPWKDFESVPLGRILRGYGGGGHQRVGSLYLTRAEAHRAGAILEEILQAVHRAATSGG